MIGRAHSTFLFLLCSLLFALPAQAQPDDFIELVERSSPAVVNISATRTAEAAASDPSVQELQELFRRFYGQPGMPPMPQPRERTSMGTGFLISSDGYLITNHHVIDGANEVYVRLQDRRELPATVVGSDPQSDIALLKVDARDLPKLEVGDSNRLRPGQWVVAIGSPFGFEFSVTAGIVSATGRSSFDRSQQYVPFIQTDVAINRGNSGGPLLDTDGRVVGVNSQIFSNTGGFMGVSFAIPIEIAMNTVKQLRERGYVSRGLLGVNIQEVDRDTAVGLGLSRPRGALVSGFSDDSAAKKAGVQVQDVILAFNGREISRSAELPPLVGATEPGSRATLTIFRNGKTIDLPVTIGELPRDATAAAGRTVDPNAAAGNPLGIAVDDLDAEQRAALGLEAGEGVAIVRVIGQSASRAGLQPGDVILMLAGKPVGSAAEFNRLAGQAAAGVPVLLLVRRGEATQFVTVTPDKD